MSFDTDNQYSKDEWANLKADPSNENLGYEGGDWEEIRTETGNSILYLPSEDEDYEEESFVIAKAYIVEDLSSWR